MSDKVVTPEVPGALGAELKRLGVVAMLTLSTPDGAPPHGLPA